VPRTGSEAGVGPSMFTQDRIVFDIALPAGQVLQHRLASSAILDRHLACLDQVVVGSDVPLAVQTGKVLVERYPPSAPLGATPATGRLRFPSLTPEPTAPMISLSHEDAVQLRAIISLPFPSLARTAGRGPFRRSFLIKECRRPALAIVTASGPSPAPEGHRRRPVRPLHIGLPGRSPDGHSMGPPTPMPPAHSQQT